MIGQITETIFQCYSLECLQEVEDFVLENRELYNEPEMKCIYTMLEVRNKMLFEDNIVRRKIYKE